MRVSRRRAVGAVIAAVAVVLVVVSALAFVPRLHRPTAEQTTFPVVDTIDGPVRGFAAAGVRVFGDVPFAAPPTGQNRWRAPQPVAPWTDVRDATRPGPGCLQPREYTFGQPGFLTPRAGTSEDCLTLGLVRPDDTTSGLPVLVWIHGGGFVSGFAEGAPYDSRAYAARGVIQVTINYRLGQLGFFAHPGLDGGGEHIANFGLLDQVAALQWVHDNIAAFGGDPDRVTIAGESAGGMSVNALMTMPRADGLFSAAITQSGLGDERPMTYRQASAAGEHTYPGLTADQLRALPTSRLLTSDFSVFSGSAPILDDVLRRRVADAFAQHREARVPWIVGSNDGEFPDSSFFIAGLDPNALRAQLLQRDPQLERAYAASGPTALTTYLLDDVVFGTPALRLAREHARVAPTYRYRFAGVEGTPSYHAADVPYVFGDVDGAGAALAAQMTDYWADFMHTGTPSVPGQPAWPRSRESGSQLMLFTPDGGQPLDVDPWAQRLDAAPQ